MTDAMGNVRCRIENERGVPSDRLYGEDSVLRCQAERVCSGMRPDRRWPENMKAALCVIVEGRPTRLDLALL